MTRLLARPAHGTSSEYIPCGESLLNKRTSVAKSVRREPLEGKGSLTRKGVHKHVSFVAFWFTHLLIVKSRGAVPKTKSRSNDVARSLRPLEIDFPCGVSKVRFLCIVWNFRCIQIQIDDEGSNSLIIPQTNPTMLPVTPPDHCHAYSKFCT